MIHLFTAALFSISANLDNFVIGITFGMRHIKIPKLSNIVIAIITSLSTFCAMEIGNFINLYLPVKYTNYIGAGSILILAIYYIVKSIIELFNNHESNRVSSSKPNNLQQYVQKSDKNKNQSIDFKEAIVLAIGLILNNLGTGIAASITGVNIYITSILTFIFSLLFLRLGVNLGIKYLGKILGKYTSLSAAILLIILSLIEWFN